MNKHDFIHILMNALYCACCSYTVLYLIYYSLNLNTAFLYEFLIGFSLVVQLLNSYIKNKAYRISAILLSIGLFTLILRPETFLSAALLILVFLIISWMNVSILIMEAEDLFKFFAAISFFLLLFMLLIQSSISLFDISINNAVNETGLIYFIHSIFYLIYNRLNHSNESLISLNYAGTKIITYVLLFFTLLLYPLKHRLTQLGLMLAYGMLNALSYAAESFITLFSNVFLFIAGLIYKLLSGISLESNSTDAPLMNRPEATAAADEIELIDPEAASELLVYLISGLFTILLFLVILWIIRKIYVNFKQERKETKVLSSQNKHFIKPEKKTGLFERIIKSGRKEKLSYTRKKYLNTVNELIKENYPYSSAMTPLEYLKTIPEEKVIEKDFRTCTEQYIQARYRNNE